MTARRYTCRRAGCFAARENWQIVCDDCWQDVPRELRNHVSKLRRLGLTALAKRTSLHIVAQLGRKRAAQPNGDAAKAARATRAYARIAAQLGEHAEMDHAE